LTKSLKTYSDHYKKIGMGRGKNTRFNTKIRVLLQAMAVIFSDNANNFIGKYSKYCAQAYKAIDFSITVLYNGIQFNLYNAMHTQYSTTCNMRKPISIQEF
jgi:hypothetical protein